MPETEVLARTEHLLLTLSRCGAAGNRPGDEETEPEFTVIFPIRGVFVHHSEGQRTVATPAVAVFFEPDRVHRISHPTGGHDMCFNVSLFPLLVEPFLNSAGRFPRTSVEINPNTFMAMLRTASREGYDALLAEELALTAVDKAMTPQVGLPSQARTDLAADAEEFLASNFTEDLGLVAIASEVGASPHHLSRVFKAVTGSTLSERRIELRIRSALRHFLEGADDIAAVAVECGFYDHAHLTNTMRKRLGLTPSQLRSKHQFQYDTQSTRRARPRAG